MGVVSKIRHCIRIIGIIATISVVLITIGGFLPAATIARAFIPTISNSDTMLLPFGSSIGSFMTNMPFHHGIASSGYVGKYLVPIMKTSADQNVLLSIYRPVIDPGDKVLMKPSDSNINYASQLKPAAMNLGVEYFSLSDIESNAPILKSKGLNFISYDLEKNLSPSSEVANPISSMQKAAAVAHQNGLNFMATPSHLLTDKYYSSFAKVADLYNLQSEAFEPNPSAFSQYVHSAISKLKNAHPGMPVSVETSTTMGSVSTMERCFSLVADVADGSVTWYNNANVDYNALQNYLAWFVSHYR